MEWAFASMCPGARSHGGRVAVGRAFGGGAEAAAAKPKWRARALAGPVSRCLVVVICLHHHLGLLSAARTEPAENAEAQGDRTSQRAANLDVSVLRDKATHRVAAAASAHPRRWLAAVHRSCAAASAITSATTGATTSAAALLLLQARGAPFGTGSALALAGRVRRAVSSSSSSSSSRRRKRGGRHSG